MGYEIKLDKCVPNFSINGMLKKCPLFRDCPELFYLKFAFELYGEIAPPGHWRDHTFFVRDLVIILALFSQNNSVVSFLITSFIVVCFRDLELITQHFLYYRNWTAALKDFTQLLQQDPEDSRAYTYRARAHAKTVCTIVLRYSFVHTL